MASNPNKSTPDSQSNLITHHIQTLKQLDKQNTNLTNIESSLEQAIAELQHEENSLRRAFIQSSTSIKEQREREKKRMEEEAVARLEDVLMGGDSDSEEMDDVHNNGDWEHKKVAPI